MTDFPPITELASSCTMQFSRLISGVVLGEIFKAAFGGKRSKGESYPGDLGSPWTKGNVYAAI